jgi:hypothetical protein
LAFHASTFGLEKGKIEGMEKNEFIFSQLKNQHFELDKTTVKMAASEVFADKNNIYINELTLYMAHFNAIPNFINEVGIDCKRAIAWFSAHYQLEIKDYYFAKTCYHGGKHSEMRDVFYFIFEDLIVDFDVRDSIVRFLFRKTELSKVESLAKLIHKFKKRKQSYKPEISLLVNNRFGIDTKTMEISKPKLSIEDNYNDDFKEINRIILKRLSNKNDKGLVLLHGKPGTGKTSYIRYLITSLKKNVIFLPLNMAENITNPGLISILIDNPNSVFVIEDAENIVVDRNLDGRSPVSALLNIADGLLADCLNIQIICTFNTDISKIDSALLRKGRLIAKYEFKELEVEKAQQLSQKLGFNTVINKPMALTAIYNQDEKEFQQSRKSNPIGFQAINNNRLAEN